MRRRIGFYNFSALYQQLPVPVSGNLIKREWFQYYDPAGPLPEFYRIVQSWDTAAKVSELHDYSVRTIWGVARRDYYLLDVFRERLNYPQLKQAIIPKAEEYGAAAIVIEDRSSGTQLLQDLESEYVFAAVPYRPSPGSDKLMRLHACSGRFENGRVFLPRTAPWLDDYVAELIGFPGTKHDDQVDSTSQALDYLREPDVAETFLRAFGR